MACPPIEKSEADSIKESEGFGKIRGERNKFTA